MEKNMIKNVLVTSAGRRVSLVKNFQKSVTKYNAASKVFCTDTEPRLSPACQVADSFAKAPKVSDGSYYDFLLNFCKQNSVSLVIPTDDTELSILSSFKKDFLNEGITIAISDKVLCDTFYLKSKTSSFFEKGGFLTPKLITDLNDAYYPIFAKLNNSSSSIGAEVIYERDRAVELIMKNKNYIFQEFLEGEEYTVDVFFDKNSSIKCIVPRKRLEVRAGEVSKALALKDSAIQEAIKSLETHLKGAYGTLTIQLFKTSDGRIFFIEINPRFGGGYPLTYFAGADFADMLIRDFNGEELEFFDNWKDKTLMLRFDSEIIIDNFEL